MGRIVFGAILLLAASGAVDGHGALTVPYPRKLKEQEWCPWCVGEHQEEQNPPGAVHHSTVPSSSCMGTSRLDDRYDPGSYGAYSAFAGPGPSEYKAGGTFEATIVLNADHNGEARWSFCPHSQTEDEQCFLDHPLTDWIDVHDHWGGPSDDCGEHCMSGEHYPQVVELPADMPAGPATLRWLWVCKNTDEIFLSCVDVEVVSDVASGSGPLPSPAPMPAGGGTPTTQPTSAPAPAPTPAPTQVSSPQPAPGMCAGEYEQCGGSDWTGVTCCQADLYCRSLNEWHSQCESERTRERQPRAGRPAPANSAMSEKSAPAIEAAPQQVASCCAAASEQCGGEGFRGPPCCQAGSTCVVKTPQLSQCVPDSELTSLMERAPVPTAHASLLAGCVEVRVHDGSDKAWEEKPLPAVHPHELPKPTSGQRFLSPAHALVQLTKLVAKFGGGANTAAEEEEEHGEWPTGDLKEADRHEL
mmetsp:Transcript_65968/g.166290  ORF Transcript_65968/g.166290 Transcript_65968/m.166290 type:complete len:471 (-) Transcript_65968:520-1932(-)